MQVCVSLLVCYANVLTSIRNAQARKSMHSRIYLLNSIKRLLFWTAAFVLKVKADGKGGRDVALAHPRMARQGEVIPRKRTPKEAQQMNRMNKQTYS